MSVYISYSHKDSDIVNKIAAYLVSKNIHIWIDKWQLNHGDSLISKIEEGITESAVLLIMLLKESVTSEWCKKELNAGLLRELEEKRVVVIPVLLEDCAIPLFLRDKYYADFRNDYDQTIKSLQDSLLKYTDVTLNRVEDGNYKIDWGIDNGIKDDNFYFNIDFVSFAKDGEYSILSTIQVTGNETITNLYKQIKERKAEYILIDELIKSLVELDNKNDLRVLLPDNMPVRRYLGLQDSRLNYEFKIEVYTRRLGLNNGFDIIFDFGSILRMIGEYREEILNK